MIFGSFLAALGQLGDRRFLKVAALGVALSLALLVAVSAGLFVLIDWAVPETLDLPLIGEVRWIGDLLGWGAVALMLGLSVFLMMPVAAAFSGLFLDEVAAAVEARHYPGLPPAPHLPLRDSLTDGVNFFGVLVAVNAVSLVAFPFVGLLAPLLFWAVNGYLLGREYFQLAAMRRIGREAANALRRANAGRVWLAGMLMAAPLSIPLVNLAIPVLGAATFTHLFHRIAGERRA